MGKPTLEGVVQEHLGFIHRTLSGLGVWARDVDDVAQEVLCAVNRGLATFDPSRAVKPAGAMRAWLHAICERQAANHRRMQRRRAEDLRDTGELDGIDSASPSAEDRFLTGERGAQLEKVLEAMEPNRRAVLVAHELHEVPMDEVASIQGIPVNTAWNRLRLAREDVRTAFDLGTRRKTG